MRHTLFGALSALLCAATPAAVSAQLIDLTVHNVAIAIGDKPTASAPWESAPAGT